MHLIGQIVARRNSIKEPLIKCQATEGSARGARSEATKQSPN